MKHAKTAPGASGLRTNARNKKNDKQAKKLKQRLKTRFGRFERLGGKNETKKN